MRKRKPIRVTSVLSFVESEWKQWWWRKVGFEVADKITEESSAFGTRVHKLIEGILKDEVKVDIDSEVPEEKCAIEVVLWMEQNKMKPFTNDSYAESLEVEVEDKKLNLIGHFDFVAEWKGKSYIVDFKTSNKMRKSFPLQKSAYAKMLSKNSICVDDGLTIRSHWDAEKKAVEFEVKEYNGLKKYWKVFKSCYDVYCYFTYAD